MALKVALKVGPFVEQSRILTAVRGDDEETELRTVCVGKKPSDDEIAAATARALLDDTVEIPKDTTHAPVRVGQFYICPECERKEKSFHPFPRGRDNGDGTFTVLTAEDLANADVSEDVKKTLTLLPTDRLEFESQMVPSGKCYYVGPEGRGETYALIRDLIRATEADTVWTTQWAYRTAANPIRAVLFGDVVGIQQYAWPDRLVAPPQLNLPAVDKRFLDAALGVAQVLRVEFDPHTFTDVRKSKIAELLASATTVTAGVTAASTPVESTSSDALLISLQQWVAERGGNVGGQDETPVNTPRKRAPRKAAQRKAEVTTAIEVVADALEAKDALEAAPPKPRKRASTPRKAPSKRTSRKSTTPTKETA